LKNDRRGTLLRERHRNPARLGGRRRTLGSVPGSDATACPWGHAWRSVAGLARPNRATPPRR